MPLQPPKIAWLTNCDDNSFFTLQRATTPRAEFEKYAAVIGPYYPEHFVPPRTCQDLVPVGRPRHVHSADTQPASITRRQAARRSNNWCFTSHEFDDAKARDVRRLTCQRATAVSSGQMSKDSGGQLFTNSFYEIS